MPLPQLIFRIALDSAPLAASPVWTRLDARLRWFRSARGRSHVLDAFQAGTLEARLDNRDGLLDNDNPASPYYGKLRVRRKMQLAAVWAGTEYPIYTGFLRGKPRRFKGQSDDEVTLRATDGFIHLMRKRRTATYSAAAAGARIVELLDDASWPGSGAGDENDAHRYIDSGLNTLDEVSIELRPVFEQIRLAEESEFGRFFITAGGAARFIDRHSFLLDPTYAEVQAIFGDGRGAELPYRDITLDDDDEQLYNEVSLTSLSGLSVEVSDPDSVEDYGASTLTKSELLLETANELADMGYYLLGRSKEPAARFPAIELNPQSNERLWPVVLEHELGTREEVRKRPPSRAYVKTQESHLEGIEHTCNLQARTWATTYRLSAADTLDYWRLGSATAGVLGSTSRWAF